MQIKPQVVFGFADAQHLYTEQGGTGQVERFGSGSEPPQCLLGRHMFLRHDIRHLGMDVHHELCPFQVEGGPQLIVAAHQCRTGLPEPVDVEPTSHLVVERHVVCGRVVSHRAERIHPALGGGGGKHPVHRLDGGFWSGIPHDRSNQSGAQRTEGRGGEDVADGQGPPRGLLDQGAQVYGCQGIATAGQEVICILRHGSDDLGPGRFQSIFGVLCLSRAGEDVSRCGGGVRLLRGAQQLVEAHI